MELDNRYIPFLDGFRGYAILLVILGHLNIEYLYLAQFGVTLFFFVSGFLITKLLIAEFKKSQTISLKDFYLRRLFRLYPALIFFLIVTLLAVWIAQYQLVILDIVAGLFYFTNYYLVYFPPVVPDNYPLTAKILWSLSVEEHFYLIFPFLFVLLYKSTNKRFLYFLAALLVFFFSLRVGLWWKSTDIIFTINETYYTTHTRADSILYGCFAALLLYAYQHTILAKWYTRFLQMLIVPALAVIVLLLAQKYEAAWYQITLKHSLTGFLLCLVVPAFLFADARRWVVRLFTNRFIIYIGKLSYSLYLFHWVSLKFISTYYSVHNTVWYTLVIVATFLLAVISYHFIERPFLKLRRRFGSHAK